MKYITAFGDEIEVTEGEAVYVDEGDSIGNREFTGTVTATFPDRFLVRLRSQAGLAIVNPAATADIEVLSR
jgi:hypothetical protein